MQNLFENFEEYRLFEIGDASAKPFRYSGPSPKKVLDDMNSVVNPMTSFDGWSEYNNQNLVTYKFTGNKGDQYECKLYWIVKKNMVLNFNKKVDPNRKNKLFSMHIAFTITNPSSDGNIENDRTTNIGEQYQILSTVVNISLKVINEIIKEFYIHRIYMIPKADEDENNDINNKRGKLYFAYLKRQIKKINQPVTLQREEFKGDDNVTYGGFVIKGGHLNSNDDETNFSIPN